MATNDINSVTVVGRVTEASVLSYSTTGVAISKFYLAVNRSQVIGNQRQESVSFVEINYYGKGAEAINQYLTKGKQICVQGELRQDRWETADRQKRQKLYVAARSIQLLSDGATNTRPPQAQPSPQQNRSTPRQTTPPPQPAAQPQAAYQDGPESLQDDQIPF